MSMNKKLQKLQAKQNAVIENKKIKEAAEAINTNTAVTTPQQPQEPDLPIYNSALYNNLDDAMGGVGNGYIDKATIVEKKEEKEVASSVFKNGGSVISEKEIESTDRMLNEGERDYLVDADKENKKPIQKTSLFGKKTTKAPSRPAPKTSQQSIPYDYVYKNGIIEVEPGLFSKSYLLQDANFKIASNEEQENMFFAFGDLLNMFDSETKLQITVFNRNVNKEEFREKVFLKLQNDGLDKYRLENNAILESKMNEGKNSVTREKYLTVSVQADDIDAAAKRFQTMDNEISAHIKKINGVDTEPMKIEERLSVLHEIYNPGTELPLSTQGEINGRIVKAFNLDALKMMGISSKDAIAPECMQFNRDYFMLGDKYCRAMFIDTLPSFLSTDFFTDLVDISANLLTSIHFESVRQDKATKILRNQMVNIDANVIEAQKRAIKSGYSPDLIPHEVKKAQEQANKIMEDITSRNQKLLLVSIMLTVYGDSIDELNKNTESLKTTAAKYLCSLKKLTYQQEYAFASCLPLGKNKTYIQRMLTTESASVFIPFSAQELSQNNGMYYGLNAVSKNLILFNRINSKNANGVILGTPGSGKSFSAKREIINVILGTNDDVYIIDPEREYAPLAALFNGEVVRIAAGSNTYINPFDMDLNYADDDDPITLKSDFIGSLCETVIGGKYGLSPVQKTVIDRCVRQIYIPYRNMLEKTGKTYDRDIAPTMDDFYKALLSQPEAEAQQIALSLEIYCRGSLNTFAHRTNVNTNARFVVYDIKDIGTGMKEMGLQVCLDSIWNKITQNKSKKKRTWFYIDEFYLLTQTDSSAKFLQQIYKRARKWGGVPTGITQNVEDLLASKEARGIINNCDFIMMLNQSPLDRAELGAMLNISPAQMSYITNADAGQGLLYTGKFIVPFIDKFPSGNMLFNAMTTKPEDVDLQSVEVRSK